MTRRHGFSVLLTAACLVMGHRDAIAHGHPAVVDPDHPEAWKHQLCAEMTTVAMQALHDRDKGQPKKLYADDGGPGPRIANAIVDKVYAEPSISSPKRAEAIGRGYCNEMLQDPR